MNALQKLVAAVYKAGGDWIDHGALLDGEGADRVLKDLATGFGGKVEPLLPVRKVAISPGWGAGLHPQEFGPQFNWDTPRHDPALVAAVEEAIASGETPPGVTSTEFAIKEVVGPYQVGEYDGNEYIISLLEGDWQ